MSYSRQYLLLFLPEHEWSTTAEMTERSIEVNVRSVMLHDSCKESTVFIKSHVSEHKKW